MVVEDSAVVRTLLEYSIGPDPRLEVCATAPTAEDALRLLDRSALDAVEPDVIAMDIRLPGMDGLEATLRIIFTNPVPIVVVAASVESEKSNTTAIDAMRVGALTVLEKPAGTTDADYETLAERLCTQPVIMSEVKLVRRHRESDSADGDRAQFAGGGRAGFKILGIVCSAGGPGALVQLLRALEPAFPQPILLVQHMTSSFLEGFASWLASACPISVKIANNGSIPTAGTVIVAAADRHLRLEAGRLRLDAREPISFQRPSGTALFQSMAQDLRTEALGVLLTDMGDDGAAGLLDIRRAGGFTIAEDESTAVVYGMPAAAVRIGAVCESLPLPAIGSRVLELVACKKS